MLDFSQKQILTSPHEPVKVGEEHTTEVSRMKKEKQRTEQTGKLWKVPGVANGQVWMFCCLWLGVGR
jgi:hypothetical protein